MMRCVSCVCRMYACGVVNKAVCLATEAMTETIELQARLQAPLS